MNPLTPIREPRNNGRVRRAKKLARQLRLRQEATMRRFAATRVRAGQR